MSELTVETRQLGDVTLIYPKGFINAHTVRLFEGEIQKALVEKRFKIVVNSQNPVSSLSSAQLSALYSRRLKTWDNGEPVQPVHQTSNAVRDAFSRDVPGATTVPAGEQPAPAVASDRDVLAFVRLKPGAIGYVSASAPEQVSPRSTSTRWLSVPPLTSLRPRSWSVSAIAFAFVHTCRM